jgi:hypothetical protein
VLRVKGAADPGDHAALSEHPDQDHEAVDGRAPAEGPGRFLAGQRGAHLAQGREEEESCLIAPELCAEQTETSLDWLLTNLATDWRNEDVGARLVLEPGENGSGVLRKTAKKRAVYGAKELAVEIR